MSVSFVCAYLGPKSEQKITVGRRTTWRVHIGGKYKRHILRVRFTRTTLWLRDLDLHTSPWEKIDFLPSTLPTMHPAHQLAWLRVQRWSFAPYRPVQRLIVSYIISKRRLGLFGHVARLRSDVPANLILRICTKTRAGERPSQEWRHACCRPSTTWFHQICRDMGVTATEALLLAEDRPFWRTIATAGGFGWSLRIMMMIGSDGCLDIIYLSVWYQFPYPVPNSKYC